MTLVFEVDAVGFCLVFVEMEMTCLIRGEAAFAVAGSEAFSMLASAASFDDS